MYIFTNVSTVFWTAVVILLLLVTLAHGILHWIFGILFSPWFWVLALVIGGLVVVAKAKPGA